ncbi:hypothetical protein N7539_006781 [Penicillium diatomitis]|uniref:Uncharacterized protein n=1 Tax=Penicillium diatomitis TaxID=2819901 RepID=A0A9W9X2D4_9EURO|nr:uncharacterized protein N7539_006781 [Penicillium diatomitis]KAJ5480887.1 hypothetical protein N7539_006781 [Penicillium diatomitis]
MISSSGLQVWSRGLEVDLIDRSGNKITAIHVYAFAAPLEPEMLSEPRASVVSGTGHNYSQRSAV